MPCILFLYMPAGPTHPLLKALSSLGQRLGHGDVVEILVIGAGAGVLTGQLQPGRVTLDCDIADCQPRSLLELLGQQSRTIASELGLPQSWLDLRPVELGILPTGWRSRRVCLGTFGRLIVYAIGRRDLIAMKFYAGRPQDREDIIAMAPTPDELDFAEHYVDALRLPSRKTDLDQIAAALRLIHLIRKAVGNA